MGRILGRVLLTIGSGFAIGGGLVLLAMVVDYPPSGWWRWVGGVVGFVGGAYVYHLHRGDLVRDWAYRESMLTKPDTWDKRRLLYIQFVPGKTGVLDSPDDVLKCVLVVDGGPPITKYANNIRFVAGEDFVLRRRHDYRRDGEGNVIGKEWDEVSVPAIIRETVLAHRPVE